MFCSSSGKRFLSLGSSLSIFPARGWRGGVVAFQAILASLMLLNHFRNHHATISNGPRKPAWQKRPVPPQCSSSPRCRLLWRRQMRFSREEPSATCLPSMTTAEPCLRSAGPPQSRPALLQSRSGYRRDGHGSAQCSPAAHGPWQPAGQPAFRWFPGMSPEALSARNPGSREAW